MNEITNGLYAEIDRLTKRVKELEAERDADRRREYGYSQETWKGRIGRSTILKINQGKSLTSRKERKEMKIKELEQEAIKELKTEKKDFAKGVLKERIREIEQVERTLKRLKDQYKEVLNKSVDEIVDEHGSVTVTIP